MKRTILKSALLVVGPAAVLLIMGLTVEGTPSGTVAIADRGDECDVVPAPVDDFEFADGTLEPVIYPVFASVGFQRIPGTIDSSPDQ